MSGTNIDHVALTVHDLAGMADFYETAIGLQPMGGDQNTRRLGAGDQVLLELRHDAAAKPRDPAEAGLFHTAFLWPSRGDLGAWLRHAADQNIRLTGASDHGVSEALYLDDPEGNGIEIYRDRPSNEWQQDGDRITMFTRRLDLVDLISAATDPWEGATAGSSIGHVHLQVGDLGRADQFFRDDLGLTQTFDGPGGIWYGWNGYHHQLAGNIWNSRGAGPRDPDRIGLAEIALRSSDGAGKTLTDPWGTRFRMI
ncbi:VOC family protein [Paracoccus caeni]|uniref:VOC family protein n=1 Tax=Paracoccus caeni TaxID=657651 RepID=A0A934SGI7_9RHOB|nr:VOC family protein [Paracoccus caeni]MBK4214774.1 VOC family protein [Paracoccus caeni]